MSRYNNDRLHDIIRAARRLASVRDCGRAAFDMEYTIQEMAARQIEHIVDAYMKLDPATKEKLGDLPVEDMAGMRVRLAQMYWNTDYKIVWETIVDDIPGVLEAAAREYEPPEGEPSVFDEDTRIFQNWLDATTASENLPHDHLPLPDTLSLIAPDASDGSAPPNSRGIRPRCTHVGERSGLLCLLVLGHAATHRYK